MPKRGIINTYLCQIRTIPIIQMEQITVIKLIGIYNSYKNDQLHVGV